jgi:hypothetical protein
VDVGGAEAGHVPIVRVECASAETYNHDPVDEVHIVDLRALVLPAEEGSTCVRANARTSETTPDQYRGQKYDDLQTRADAHADHEDDRDLPSHLVREEDD